MAQDVSSEFKLQYGKKKKRKKRAKKNLNTKTIQVRWYMPVIPALGRFRERKNSRPA
jgi:hypothetical protein